MEFLFQQKKPFRQTGKTNKLKYLASTVMIQFFPFTKTIQKKHLYSFITFYITTSHVFRKH